jgi:aryl-alcohol dehydrogenase-like predicted oxidoreductase
MLAVLFLLLAGLVAFVWVRSAARASVDPSRRSFLTGAASGAGTALGALGLGAAAGLARGFRGVGNDGYGWGEQAGKIFVPAPYTHPEYREGWKGSRVRAHRRLGRTGWEVSDIVLGTGRISGETGERVARLALERGVNYFDTSPDYSGSGSEQAMGKAIAEVPRDEIFVATKFCTPDGHLPAGSSVADYQRVIEESLGRLGLDYVDLVHVHSCDDVERLLDPNVHEAFDRLKEAGKVRFLGFSTHTPRLVEVTEAAIASGRFDVMMLAYHHGIWPALGDLIRRARAEQDMGVVAMKTLKGAKHRGLEDFQPYADSYAQAALKWALDNPDVSCAVVSFFELQHVDEFLYASGKPFTTADADVLRRYDTRVAGTYCAPHCGACLSSCPEGVPIHDVLRQRM